MAPQLEARAAQQAVGDRGAHDAGGGLGPQREAVAALVGEGVHLLLDHVGEFADRAFEELGVLDHGHADFLVAVGVEHGSRTVRFDELPHADVGRQDVFHAGDRLDIASSCLLVCQRARDSEPERLTTKRAPSSIDGVGGHAARAGQSTSTVTPAALPSTTRSGGGRSRSARCRRSRRRRTGARQRES